MVRRFAIYSTNTNLIKTIIEIMIRFVTSQMNEAKTESR